MRIGVRQASMDQEQWCQRGWGEGKVSSDPERSQGLKRGHCISWGEIFSGFHERGKDLKGRDE